VNRSRTLAQDARATPSRRRRDRERCDRCCAEAVVHVVMASGLDLVLCGHHAREHELGLIRSGAVIRVDGRVPSFYS
jgi:hypothetical protein